VRAAPEAALSNVYHTSFGVPVMNWRSYYVLTMAHCGAVLSVTNAMGFPGAQALNRSQFTDGPGFGRASRYGRNSAECADFTDRGNVHKSLNRQIMGVIYTCPRQIRMLGTPYAYAHK